MSRSSPPTQQAVTKVGTQPINQPSALLLVVPVLPAMGAIQSILEAQTTCCAMIDNGAHHIDHLVAASLRNDLVHARCELCDHISFAVFDTTDEGRGAADALIDEGGGRPRPFLPR